MTLNQTPDRSRVPDERLGWAIGQLLSLGRGRGFTLYNICFRSEGVGLEWYEQPRQGVRTDFKHGLVVHGWYPDLNTALFHEIQRLLPGRT